jgi:hypothetical protein
MGHGDYNQNKPQKLGDANNQQGNYYDNDTRNDWRRAAGGTAENRPNYVGGYRAPHGEPGERAGPELRKGAKGPHRWNYFRTRSPASK